jgi:hypothetical protein
MGKESLTSRHISLVRLAALTEACVELRKQGAVVL